MRDPNGMVFGKVVLMVKVVMWMNEERIYIL